MAGTEAGPMPNTKKYENQEELCHSEKYFSTLCHGMCSAERAPAGKNNYFPLLFFPVIFSLTAPLNFIMNKRF